MGRDGAGVRLHSACVQCARRVARQLSTYCVPDAAGALGRRAVCFREPHGLEGQVRQVSTASCRSASPSP